MSLTLLQVAYFLARPRIIKLSCCHVRWKLYEYFCFFELIFMQIVRRSRHLANRVMHLASSPQTISRHFNLLPLTISSYLSYIWRQILIVCSLKEVVNRWCGRLRAVLFPLKYSGKIRELKGANYKNKCGRVRELQKTWPANWTATYSSNQEREQSHTAASLKNEYIFLPCSACSDSSAASSNMDQRDRVRTERPHSKRSRSEFI